MTARRPLLFAGALLAASGLGERVALASAGASLATLPPHSVQSRRFDAWLGPRYDPISADLELPQRATVLRFDIAPGPLDVVVETFRSVTGLTITPRVPASVLHDIQSPGVSGLYTAERALGQLLTGTGVTYQFNDAGAVTLELRVNASAVEVSAAPSMALPKMGQPLRDIPQTVTVIPHALIESQAATTLRDVLRNVPGITYQAGEGGGGLPGDNLTLRGFSAGNDIFVDGVRDPGAFSRDAFNLEQVEVIKGPSSSVAGRGSTGGLINQVTKSPTLDAARRGGISIGNAGLKRTTVDFNQPLAQSKGIAVRLNAMWTDSGVPGRDVVENQSWGIAPSLAFGLSGPFRGTVSYQHLTNDNVPDYGLPWAALDASPAVAQDNFYGLRDYDFERIETDAVTARLDRQLQGETRLQNISRFARADRDSAITAPRPPNRQLQRRTMGNEVLTNQTSIITAFETPGLRHELTGGLEFLRETTHNRNSAQATNQPQTTIGAPNPADRPFGPMPANIGNPSETTVNTVGLYAFDTVSFGDRWEASGGLRLDRAAVDFQLTNNTTGAVTELDALDTMVSWRAGAVYKPRPAGSIYVGLATSFNPAVDAGTTGAALSDAPTAVNSSALDPEESRHFEAGTKWDTRGGRLSLNGALFRTEKINARTRNAADQPFVLAGKQRVLGVEVGVSGRVTNAWMIALGYSYMASEFERSANPAEQGSDLAFTPKSAFNVWSTLELPRGVTIGGGSQFMDGVFRNATNTASAPSYWIAGAAASYRVNENLTLRLNGNNLTDRQYVDRVGGGHYIPGPRRQVTLGADVSF